MRPWYLLTVPIVLVQGPYLVRHASINETNRGLDLRGDLDGPTTVTVFGPSSLCSISWNGEKVAIESRNGNEFTFSLDGPAKFELPVLGSWKYDDSLPEIAPDYEASPSTWIGKRSSL